MGAVKSYDFRKVITTVGRINLSGYGDDGGIEVDWGSAAMEKAVGAYGDVTYSKINDESCTVTITVRESSRTYRDLMALQRTQAAGEGPIEPLAFYMRDLINGDELKDRYCVFMELPSMSKGRTAGDRVFVLDLPNARGKALFGAKITN